MYPEELVIPMKEELTENGFKDLTTPEQVVEALGQKGTTLLVINSVCGCSAGAARPGVLLFSYRRQETRSFGDCFCGI